MAYKVHVFFYQPSSSNWDGHCQERVRPLNFQLPLNEPLTASSRHLANFDFATVWSMSVVCGESVARTRHLSEF